MSVTISTELRGLNQTMSVLANVLGVDAKKIVAAEAGQLAGQIAAQIGPKTIGGASKAIQRDMKRHLSIKPQRENLKGIKQGSGDVKWLYAGNDFIAGIQRENDMVSANAAEATRLLRASQKKPVVKAWSEVGTRKNQKVMILNRIRVSKKTFGEVFRALQKKTGQARATFAFTAAKLTGKRYPAWVSRHFANRSEGKAIFKDSGLHHPVAPFIEFGSRAKGMVSNAKLSGIIEGAAKYRAKLMAEKVKKVLSGYAYDLKTGATFKPRAGKEYGSNVILPS